MATKHTVYFSEFTVGGMTSDQQVQGYVKLQTTRRLMIGRVAGQPIYGPAREVKFNFVCKDDMAARALAKLFADRIEFSSQTAFKRTVTSIGVKLSA